MHLNCLPMKMLPITSMQCIRKKQAHGLKGSCVGTHGYLMSTNYLSHIKLPASAQTSDLLPRALSLLSLNIPFIALLAREVSWDISWQACLSPGFTKPQARESPKESVTSAVLRCLVLTAYPRRRKLWLRIVCSSNKCFQSTHYAPGVALVL